MTSNSDEEKREVEKLYLYTFAENEDVDGLKLCVEQLGLRYFHTELYSSILLSCFMRRWTHSFNFLITLPFCHGTNVLLDVVRSIGPECQYYALELIENGADVHGWDSDCNSLLHYAITRNCRQVVEALISNGVDVNERNRSGETPLHSLIIANYPFTKRRFCATVSFLGNHKLYDNAFEDDALMELLDILLSNGADPIIRNRKGYTALDLALMIYKTCRNRSESMSAEKMYAVVEILYYYTYDHVVPFHTLMEMISLRVPLLEHVFDDIRQITMNYNKYMHMENDPIRLIFSMDREYLEKIIAKFDHIIVELFKMNLSGFYAHHISVENVDILLHSHLANNVIEFIKDIRITQLINVYYNKMYLNKAINEELVMELIYYFLSYGLEVYEEDLQTVYNNFGRCELFNLLLHMDIQTTMAHYKRDLWLCLLYIFPQSDLDEFFTNLTKYNLKNITHLLPYYGDQRLRDYCRMHRYDNHPLMALLDRLPQVPLLQELARNAFRTFFIQQLKITTPSRFYTMLKCLPIGRNHEKILSLSQKLYY